MGVATKLWSEYKPVLDAVDVSDAGPAKATKRNPPLLKNTNKAVQLYEASVK